MRHTIKLISDAITQEMSVSDDESSARMSAVGKPVPAGGVGRAGASPPDGYGASRHRLPGATSVPWHSRREKQSRAFVAAAFIAPFLFSGGELK